MTMSFRHVKTIVLVSLFMLSVVVPVVAEEKIPALDKKNMDLSIKPGDDFFEYANGAYNAKLTIPPDKPRYNEFDVLREKTDKMVRELLEEVSQIKNATPGSAAQKISDFYFTGMDIQKINAEGIAPLKEEFARIEKIQTITDVQDAIAYAHTYGNSPLFGGTVFQDLKENTIFRFYLMQAGVGLPDVEYYTKDDPRSQEIRNEYIKHMTKMFELLGDKPETALANANTCMAIETRLARKSLNNLQMRNIPALYNKMTLAQVEELAPAFDWKRYFKNISDKDFGDLIVGMPEFFKEVNLLMKEIPVNDWKTYLRWDLINSNADFLSDDFINQNFNFYSKYLSGNEAISDRWKRVTRTTNGMLGELVGQLYVEKYFPKSSKDRMMVLVDNLKKALQSRLEKLEWMGPETKKEALEKLAAMRVKIGYPDKWRDFSKMEIKRDAYVLNVLRASRFLYYLTLDDFGKPVDRDRWGFTPQTVNAGYNPINNDITFPAGILQPPYFNSEADDAVNYGSIGVVIGHEMTHGFDDQGRNFDKDGNMKDWWTKEDADKFNRLTQVLVDQYDGFVAIDDVHVNGKLSLGESLADYGGLTVSLTAYKMSLEGKKAPEAIDGFTDVQRFFLSFAQLWRGKIRDQFLKRIVTEDVHPWGKFRTNGAPFNVPEFYKAFDIKPTDKLYRSEAQRAMIW